MTKARRLVYENSPKEIFAPVFFGVPHLDDGLLEYSNASHTTGAWICAVSGLHSLQENEEVLEFANGELSDALAILGMQRWAG